MYIVVSCPVLISVVVLCVVVVILCVFVFTLDVGLLARSQYWGGPATGHFDIGFSWFPCA